jgi:hypothetical protein
MHRRAAWGLCAALAAGAVAPVVAADPAPSSESKPWYARLIGGESKKPEEKTFGDTAARPAVVYGPMDPATLTEALKAEQSAYQRRLDVCLKLRQIAARTNDDQLAEQADDLERQATALYHARTAKLGVKAALRSAPEPAADVKPAAAVTVAPPTPASATDQFREVPRD